MKHNEAFTATLLLGPTDIVGAEQPFKTTGEFHHRASVRGQQPFSNSHVQHSSEHLHFLVHRGGLEKIPLTVAFGEPHPESLTQPVPKILFDRCNNKSASFAWQIRPVLGNEFIRPGNSVNFVQFSVATDPSEGLSPTKNMGRACISVIWRKPAVTGWFGKRSNEYLGDQLTAPERCYEIDYYNTLANRTLSVMDIGQGAVTVRVRGTFLPGRTVHLGNTYLTPDSIPSSHDELTFTTLASAIIAADRVYFVGRDGQEIEAIHPEGNKRELKLDDVAILPYSESQLLVKLKFKAPKDRLAGEKGPGFTDPGSDPWVVVIGTKVFGLSDAPFFAHDIASGEIQLIVPTALIQASPRVELRRLLWSNVSYRATLPIPPNGFSKASSAVSKATILSSQNGLTIGLVGTGLDKVSMVFPPRDLCPKCEISASGSTFLRVTLPKSPEPKKGVGETAAVSKKDEAKALDPTDGLRQRHLRHNQNLREPMLERLRKRLSPAPSVSKANRGASRTLQVRIRIGC